MWQKTQNLKKRRLYFYKMKESWKNSERPEGKREVGRNGGKIVWQTLGTQKQQQQQCEATIATEII